jgi:hypothetical protein
MSHTVTIKTEIKDIAAIRAACSRLKLAAPAVGKHTLFDGQTVTGTAVKLDGWYYPVVADSAGVLHFDNYGGRWGEEKHLAAFKQAYAVEKAKIEARKKGYTVTETKLPGGAIRLTVNQGV